MLIPKQTAIPALVRVKPGALDRMGIYAERHEFMRVLLFFSKDFDDRLMARLTTSLRLRNIKILQQTPVESISFEKATELFRQSPRNADAVIGFGGGKALDVAKYVAFLCRLPFLSVPTSLSNDGFCSPQSSLTVDDRRQPLPSVVPFGVILDTAVCLNAPDILWHSGVGDLVSKLTAVTDWKMAFHATGTPVDDFAALLSDASVYQFLARPMRDLEGMTLLGTALLLNGISMSICGSSRPASGSEHLISHALDTVSKRPRLHGLQVGVATYLISLLQGQNSSRIAALFDATGSGAPLPAIHLTGANGWKQPAWRPRSSRTFTPSYPRATASRKSKPLCRPTGICDSASGTDPRRLATGALASREGTQRDAKKRT